MKIVVNHVGASVNRDKTIEWPDGWPIPRVGDEINVPLLPQVTHIRVVEWYPEGNYENPEPFVYIVVGPRRG